MELKDVQEAIIQIGVTWKEYKGQIDTKFAEIAKTGVVSSETKESLAKLETKMAALDEFKTRMDNLERVARETAKVSIGLDRADVTNEELEAKGFYIPKLGTKAEREEARAAFNKFIVGKGNSKGGTGAGDFSWAEGLEKKNMSIISDPDGGYLTIGDFSGRVVKRIFETSPMRQLASVQTISNNTLEGMNDRDQAGAEWDSETQTPGDTTTPQVGKWKIPVHELRARTYATMQFLEDANIDVESWLAMKQADKFARTENAAFVLGSGSNQPAGFLSYPLNSAPSSSGYWSQLQYIPTGADGAFPDAPNSGDCLITLIQSLIDFYRTNASFVMTRTSVGVVRQMKDSYGRYLWEPSLAAGTPSKLLGFGVTEFADMPEIGDNSASIAFGDFKTGYQIVDRIGIATLRDPFTSQPYIKFITRKRTGGAVIDFDAIKVLKFAET